IADARATPSDIIESRFAQEYRPANQPVCIRDRSAAEWAWYQKPDDPPAPSKSGGLLMTKGDTLPEAKLSGQVIIDQLIRNMEMGRFEMAYSVLFPCIFSIYLHPEDYARLSTVQELIREDARR